MASTKQLFVPSHWEAARILTFTFHGKSITNMQVFSE